MLIGILAGSFDPIHLGHLDLINRALAARPFDKIILLPTMRNPNKPPPLAFNRRVAMVRQALKEANLKASISLLEQKQPGPLYTYNALLALKKRYPNDQLQLIMGEDSYPSIKKYMEKLNLFFEVLVLPRTNISSKIIRDNIKAGKPLVHLMPKKTAALAEKYYT